MRLLRAASVAEEPVAPAAGDQASEQEKYLYAIAKSNYNTERRHMEQHLSGAEAARFLVVSLNE